MDLREIYKTDHGDLSHLSILLLEEKDEDAKMMMDLLKGPENHYELFLAKSFEEADLIIHREYIDLVVFNLSLAGLKSLENLIAPAVDLNKPFAIIALVDESDEYLGVEASKIGAEDYLVKGSLDKKLISKSVNLSIKSHHLRQRNLNMVLLEGVTGLFSRRGFMMMAKQELRVAERYKKKRFFIFVEIDEMEDRMEKLGQIGVEKVLRETATILRHSFRGADILAYLENLEFAGLAVGAAVDSSSTIHARLKDNLHIFNSQRVLGFRLALNAEIVTYDPEHPQTIEEMMAEAEASLAKKRRHK
ncbi:MAG: diguanylate cyclase [Deltaproteobacteria bacterium]|nr:diguanylate cyclase [Deltaproteobacteria bacterium]